MEPTVEETETPSRLTRTRDFVVRNRYRIVLVTTAVATYGAIRMLDNEINKRVEESETVDLEPTPEEPTKTTKKQS
jgi:hypothetical protein